MIKIEIENVAHQTQEYTTDIINLVAFRVSILRQSLSHLNGSAVHFAPGDFRSFKAVTKKIIKILGKVIIIPPGEVQYTNSINNYRQGVNRLATLNINGLLQLCDDLLANTNQQLSELLICEPNNLIDMSTDFLNANLINTDINIQVIKLAFDYTEYDEIGKVIRSYFRRKNFVKMCPYCNISEALHQTNGRNEPVKSYELDHFYHKAKFPLLSYSFFNLVPSDHDCNTVNKKDIEFNREYYINPYESGYSDNIRFCPIRLTTSYDVVGLNLEIIEPLGTHGYKRINGNNLAHEEGGVLGNLNIFRIRSKYLGKTDIASKMLRDLHKENKHFRNIRKYLKTLNAQNPKDDYVIWYEKEFLAAFKGVHFKDKPYSKFKRDLHDYYFSENKSRWNKYIRELINTV